MFDHPDRHIGYEVKDDTVTHQDDSKLINIERIISIIFDIIPGVVWIAARSRDRIAGKFIASKIVL